MIVGVHALTGAVLGGLCPRRWQAFVVGAASHLVGDALPHRDLEIPQEAVLLAAALTTVALLKGLDSCEFAGAVGAATPDIENLAARLFGIPEGKLLMPTHRGFHGRKLDGVHSQAILAAACLAYLAATTACARKAET